jgi:hypothetical protein
MDAIKRSSLESLATPLNDNDLTENADEENGNKEKVFVKAGKDIQTVINTTTTRKEKEVKKKKLGE